MQLRAHASLSRWFATGRILLPAILVIWPGIVHTGAPPAAPKVPASLPLAPDCLIAGRIRDLRALSDKVGEILAAMDRAPDRGHVRLALGARLYNPKLAGVDTSRPLRFYGMNAKKFPRPWVYQFEVSDIAALKQGIASGQQPTPAGKGIWRFDDLAGIKGRTGWLQVNGKLATWGLDPKAADALLRWQRAEPHALRFRTPGQLHVHIAIQKWLKLFDQEFGLQVEKMKARMRVAMARAPKRADREQEIAATQADLDSAVAMLRQIKRLEMGIEMAAGSGRISFSVSPLPDSLLAEVFQTHARGGLTLPARCPGEAAMVVAHNLMVKQTIRSMLLRAFGMDTVRDIHQAALPGTGETLIAVFLPQEKGGTAELLELRTGQKAQNVWQRWARFVTPPSGGADPLPFTLKSLPAASGKENPLRLAELALNDAALGPSGTQAVRRLLGEKPLVAQDLRKGTSVLAVGRDPKKRIRQVHALAGKKAGSLLMDPAFLRSMSGVPVNPNVILYVSPGAVSGWLALARLPVDQPQPEDLGFVASARFAQPGLAEIHVRVPTAALRRALLRLPKPAPAARPKDDRMKRQAAP